MKEKATILVIDDEKGVCDFFEKVLTEEGYRVLSSLSGESGLVIAKRENPDLVLLDLKMPGMDGIEALRQVKKIDKNIVVVILTAYGTMETARVAMRLGAFDYLTKPFDLEYVKAVVKDGLKSTLAGAVAQLRESKAVREAMREKARLEKMRHCQRQRPCLWEVALRAFLLGDDSLAIKWTEDPRVSKEEKLGLMELAQVLRADMGKGK